MKSVKIYGIMVIYNKCLNDSIAYQCLKEQDIELVICDNSITDYGNRDVALGDQKVYISMDGNKGISCAYNRALEHIYASENLGVDDWICLFDDDTDIPEEYFKELRKSSGKLMLPVVRDLAGIMSPVKMKHMIARRFSSKDELLNAKGAYISGINSAMAVRADIFKNYRYNEQMFLDYIDHMFIIDMREKCIYPQVLPVEIFQNFSAMEDSKESERKRFHMQKKDLRIFYKKNILMYYYIVIKKHLKLVKKYKDIRMFKC